MKRALYSFLFLLGTCSIIMAQTLVDTFAFEWTTQLNSFWGITHIGDALIVGADGGGDLYKIDQDGLIVSILETEEEVNFNHGMVWDGEGYWVAEDYTTSGARLVKLNTSGNIMEEFVLPPVNGGNSSGVGGLTLDNGHIWYSVYYPDFDDYPFNYAYQIDLNTQTLLDTIPLYGQQVYGLAAKGDTIFYVTDDLDDDEERIYAYSKTEGDTLFSWPLLDPDGDSSPRGLHYDGEHLWLVAKRPGSSAFAYSMLYKYEILDPDPMPMPTMTVSSSTLDFGQVGVGDQATLNVTLYNIGDGTLDVTELSTDNPAFIITSSPILPFMIEPNDSIILQVDFIPATEMFYNNTLTIESNSASSPIQIIDLIGEGVFSVSGLTSISKDDFRIFPNPVKDYLNVAFLKEYDLLEYQIYNSIGQLVLNQSNATTNIVSNYSIDVKTLKNDGLYFLKLIEEKGGEVSIPFFKSNRNE